MEDTGSDLTSQPDDEAVEAQLRKWQINAKRKIAKKNQTKKATKMLKLSNNKFSPASVGDTVRFLVPVDRSKCAPRNVLGVVMNVDAEKYLYRIGTSHGVLKSLFTRGDFNVCKESFLHTDDVPEGVTSVREAHGKTAISAGGGSRNAIAKLVVTPIVANVSRLENSVIQNARAASRVQLNDMFDCYI